MKKVCVLGLGYIGLPTSVLLAKNGFRVYGVDINENLVKSINKGNSNISEPEIDNLLRSSLENGTFSAHIEPVPADIFIIAVPTPFKSNYEDNGIPKPNIEYVLQAAKNIKKVIREGNLVILESTSPVGTTEKLTNIISFGDNNKIMKYHFAYCPERVLPGKIIKELIDLDRILGTEDIQSQIIAHNFYKSFCKGKIHLTTTKIAELSKLTENSYRDVNIAFANEISLICETLQINVSELISLANCHPRVNILEPGCGVGGHCIAVDPWYIASDFPDNTKLIQAARLVNNLKPKKIVEKIDLFVEKLIEENGSNPIIGIMGLAYKPDIDDLRESPALQIALDLKLKGRKIICNEPNISILKNLQLCSVDEITKKADLLIYLVAHKEYKKIDHSNHKFFDFCGITRK